MTIKLAKYISVLGHPLLTIPLVLIVALFNFEEPKRALFISLLIVGGIFIPLTIKMYNGTKDGTYTNFDISEKSQRQSWYFFALALLAIVTIVLFVTNQSRVLCLSMLFAFILLLTSQLMNYYIKSSLHVSLNVFLAFSILPMSLVTGIVLFVFVILISWSRLALKRHTLKEILAGAFIGFAVGILLLLINTRTIF
ncbi:MAG: phosphatase PAP2 family protein [Chryseolinea sp.]